MTEPAPVAGASSVSLQDAFAAFVVSRKTPKSASAARKKKKGGSAKGEGGDDLEPASPLTVDERRARLRALFVETARKYIGVPYGRKHHAPHGSCDCEGCCCSGRQLYHEPLFLDCCGLVRKVARDMQRQLGFRLGRFNQAYQYDTLPVRLAHASQLRPGDLVFYSGTLLDPKSRRHAFDMTHVEVFVGGGTGEATIGSRERYKWVMEYPSYRFESQRWLLIAHHFCSLDPWLDGLCVPQHPELWRARRRGGGGQQQQQQGAAAAAAAAAGTQGGAGDGGGGREGQVATAVAELAWDSSRYSIFRGGAAGAGAGQEPGGEQQLQSGGDDG